MSYDSDRNKTDTFFIKEVTLCGQEKNLKEKAKLRVQTNYWRAVLVALLLTLFAGAGIFSSNGSHAAASSRNSSSSVMENQVLPKAVFGVGLAASPSGIVDELNDIGENLRENSFFFAGVLLGIIALAGVFFVIIQLVMLVLNILIFNPLAIGCHRFFTKNLNEDAQLKEICYAFDYNYKNNIKTMFLRDLYVFLWSLLFVIPGIVKSYEYRMVPYILGENPDMNKENAFAISRQMMDGNKWNAFVLDLSWIGWQILNGCTLGLLGVFYLNPYMHQTDAALYEALKTAPAPEQF